MYCRLQKSNWKPTVWSMEDFWLASTAVPVLTIASQSTTPETSQSWQHVNKQSNCSGVRVLSEGTRQLGEPLKVDRLTVPLWCNRSSKAASGCLYCLCLTLASLDSFDIWNETSTIIQCTFKVLLYVHWVHRLSGVFTGCFCILCDDVQPSPGGSWADL